MSDRGSKRIRIFRADSMFNTDFAGDERPEEFIRAGIEYVADAEAADIVLARGAIALVPFGRLAKRFAVWTDEPRYDLHVKPIVKIPRISRPVHVMNVHLGMFTDNYRFFRRYKTPLDRDRSMQAFRAKPRRAAMLATYAKQRNWLHWQYKKLSLIMDSRSALKPMADGSLLLDGRNIDLNQRRQKLALFLQSKGSCDIYGRGWPKTVSITGESRGEGWPAAKQAVLADYAINIALENTIASHYVTEKIWDAIKSACLPVYHGIGNGIYDDFPEDSFIEVADKDVPALAEEIMQIGEREACDRYELCMDVYNRVAAEARGEASAASERRRSVEFIASVMEQQPVR